jgi:serine phosphatase RsbU (regulator of sigma subunit)
MHPSGARSRVPLTPIPFLIGRQPENNFVLRDNRASRNHARIVAEQGEHYIEDLKSSHGTFVNGARITRQKLEPGDRIEFGFPDSYSLVFSFEGDRIQKILDQFSAPKAVAAATGSLGKIRALVDVARALQNSLSTDDVLAAVVDAALAITGFERGFLLLNREGDLQVAIARKRNGAPISNQDFDAPLHELRQALYQRRELLSMTCDPAAASFPEKGATGENLRSGLCVPLVRVRAGSGEETCLITSKSDAVGLVYLDSRETAIDLSSGNRELLQTLALEASTILENARLLEEERIKQRMEEELGIAREIQASLLPRKLPSEGWFRAAGSSIPSHEVGGDCFDVRQISPNTWSAVVTDVSGKGVSSALLAALVQGSFLLASDSPAEIRQTMSRINHFLNERTEGEKYVTVFYCTLRRDGTLHWVNAGHCTPFLVRRSGEMLTLGTTGMPLGMIEEASFEVDSISMQPGDKIVAYSDGLTEARNVEGKFFEADRLEGFLRKHAPSPLADLHTGLMREVEKFTGSSVQHDDITALLIEFAP